MTLLFSKPPTELGYACHRLPMGRFDNIELPPSVLELEGDGVIEHYDPPVCRMPGPQGPVFWRSRKVVFLCHEGPRYAVHTLLAPTEVEPAWLAWMDRYENWQHLVEGHPEFGHRDLHGRRVRHARAHAEELAVQVLTHPAAAEDPASAFG